MQYHLLNSFDDTRIPPNVWNNLLSKSSSDIIFMTWEWQSTWWKIYGRGKLLIIVAEENGEPSAIAPLFEDGGMIFFIGSGGSDYLDFIGEVSDPDVLENILLLAVQQVPDFLGFRFYHIPDYSVTPIALTKVAERIAMYFCEEGELPSPQMEIIAEPDILIQAINKKSLVRHETWFDRNGGKEVHHFFQGMDIMPLLDDFFKQHIKRWEQTPYPSLFLDDSNCLFFRELSKTMTGTGWLRFTQIKWKDQSVAFHFGFNYKGSFLWYKPSFDIDLANRSPGEVLLRQLLILARKEEANTFDFGLGDEAFKKRFATRVHVVRTWGIYPQSVIKQHHK